MMRKNALQTASGAISIQISSDGMEAYMTLDPSKGIVTDAEINHLIHLSGICYGFENAQTYLQENELDKQPGIPFLLALGDMPETLEGEIHYFFASSEKHKPLIQNDGSVDYRQISHYENVLKDQVLAEFRPAQPGQSGKNIFGEMVPPIPKPNPADFVGTHTMIPDDHPYQIWAQENGYPLVSSQGKIQVEKKIVIHGDVNYETGNIFFIGDVEVIGDIKADFDIKVGGDLIVEGNLESPICEVGGNLIAQGIISPRHELIVHGNITCDFIENSKIVCHGNITCEKYIFGSTVHCCGSIALHNLEEGKISGGVIRAQHQIATGSLGAHFATPTEVSIGYNPILHKKGLFFQKKLLKLNKELSDLEKDVHVIEKIENGEMEFPEAQKEQILARKEEIFSQYETVGKLKRVLEEKAEDAHKTLRAVRDTKSEIWVHQTLYPGILINIRDHSLKIHEQQDHVHIFAEDKEIKIEKIGS